MELIIFTLSLNSIYKPLKNKTMQTNQTIFRNDRCIFQFDIERKEIIGDDLTDSYNLPRCYNKTSRSFKKALETMAKQFDDDVTMYSGMDIIENAGVRMRSYCAMD